MIVRPAVRCVVAVVAVLATLAACRPIASPAASEGSGTGDALACLGESVALLVDHQTPYVQIRVGDQTGYFALDFGSTVSGITPSAFTRAPQPQPGSGDRYSGFEFFGEQGTVRLAPLAATATPYRVRQAGVIGTDILASHVHTLDYSKGRVHRASAARFCSDSQLTSAGFRALSTSGHYGPDPARLTCPQAGGPPHCVNVPTVALRIGPVQTVAQLDTGYDDGQQPFSVNINAALLKALHDAGLRLTPRPDIALRLSTCVPGVFETLEAWQPEPAMVFGLIDAAGSLLARGAGRSTLFVKRTPPPAAGCGGIGTWSEPAAQLGASFVAEGALVVDPFSSRVWLR